MRHVTVCRYASACAAARAAAALHPAVYGALPAFARAVVDTVPAFGSHGLGERARELSQ